MFRPYFVEQMMKLIHSSFHIYRAENELVQRFGSKRIEKVFFTANRELLHGMYTRQAEGYPVIRIENGAVFALFSGGMPEGMVLIAGPVANGPLGQADIMKYRKRYGREESENYIPSVCPLDRFLSGILLLHEHLTGEELTAAQLWEKNKECFPPTVNMQSRISHDIFDYLENPGMHNPYDQELRELESIEKGDVQALARSISETYEGEIGILANDPLRSGKNVAVGNITLASRAAIRGGMSVEQSFSLADSLIRQVEEIQSLPEVEAFKRESQYTYARLVNEGKMRRKEKQKTRTNPLIGKTKDYIFSHLHDTIQITDIADNLRVNADYLSHLFSESENMTITEYIRREKIRRGENLLKYSDYQIRDIAFYLGFCSQSHFSRAFRQVAGVSPNEYRKQFGYEKSWKTK